MAELLTIALNAEGATDYRFLKPIIERTIQDIILNSDKDVELYPIQTIDKKFKDTYVEDIVAVAKDAYKSGIKCLILHCDADSRSSNTTVTCKIEPAIDAINNGSETNILRNKIIPLIPVAMTEAWMLADKELFKSEINAENIDNEILNLTKKAENFSDPKDIIIKAIAVAQKDCTRRHRNLTISELYIPLGQKIPLDKLKLLTSYQKFYSEIKSICLPYC